MTKIELDELLEQLGQLIDTVDNHLAMQGNHMPVNIRADAAKSGLSDIRTTLREIYFANGGEDVWADADTDGE